MPDTTAEELTRRYREDDPVEVRTVPGTGITLRVLGFTIDGNPVIHGQDRERLTEYHNSLYQCHYCQDTGQVYLHGEEREPDVGRRGPGETCRWCSSLRS